MKTILSYLAFCSVLILCSVLSWASETKRPHILFVMADDMGWGQTVYRGHPVLKTPNLDEMAASGQRAAVRAVLCGWKQRWEFKSFLDRAQSPSLPKNNSNKAKK